MISRSALTATFCLAAALAAFGPTPRADAALRLPKIFGDSMVVQQGASVPVWGWAKPGEKVTVAFAGEEKTAVADERGKWMVRLDAMPASKSAREMTVSGENTLTLKDVLVGEVWICGGQSNMELEVRSCLNFPAERAAATHPLIRQIKVARCNAPSPADDVAPASGAWTPCSPESVGQFTAVGYFFAREIAAQLDVPVGIINDCLGSTRIEPWTPPEGFRAVPELQEISRRVDAWIPRTEIGRQKYAEYLAQVKAWLPKAEAAAAAGDFFPPIPQPPVPGPDGDAPTSLYNGMIAPVIPCAIRGALWYQGEKNHYEGLPYFHKMKALIGGWRQVWGEGDFPFYFVQLAGWGPFDANAPEGCNDWSRTREAQLMSLAIPNTGMAVTIDIGDVDQQNEIHPKNKQDLGKRLALWALAKTYGKPVAFSGPIYKSMSVDGNRIRLRFDHAEGGLVVGEKKGLDPVKEISGGKLKGFAIAGEDRVWHWADAVIEGDSVLVGSDAVTRPAAVRYGFAANPVGVNLYNEACLPASPFRTDDW